MVTNHRGDFDRGCRGCVTLAIASRQSRVAARQVLFDEMRGFDREIEVQLNSTANELTKDARFMSTLPPIQGIIDARSGTGGGESEEVWRGRLEMIYEGLLRANPDYLSITYTEVQDDSGTDVVRVERHRSDAGFVRRVPASRLGSFDDPDLLQQTTALSAGDILVLIRRQTDPSKNMRQDVRLVACTPVFDEMTGELFGFVSIQTDLLNQIVLFLERVEQSTAGIYITDADGQVWVTDDPEIGVDVKNREVNVTSYIPSASAFLANPDQHRYVDQGQGWIANRITLDQANLQTTVTVVLALWE